MGYWIRPICSNVLTIQTRTFKDPGSQAGPRACDRSICRHFLQSKCTFGDLCQFSHEVPELTSAPPGQTLKNQGPQHQGCKLWNDMEKPHQWYETTKNRGRWLARTVRVDLEIQVMKALQAAGLIHEDDRRVAIFSGVWCGVKSKRPLLLASFWALETYLLRQDFYIFVLHC